MYDLAKKARAGMKSKAERLAGEKDRKTDSSDWTPPEKLNADVKTGMRPVSRKAYKDGGKVADCAPMARADRKARKAGGRVEQKGEQPMVDRYVNRDLKKANEYRDGKKHVGALKDGGRAKHTRGGEVPKGENPYAFGTGIKPTMTAKQVEDMMGIKGDSKGPVPKSVPLPPRRPSNLTPAANNPIKPDMKKYLPGDDITGPPKKVRKDGGRTNKQDGGPMMMDPRLGIVKPKAMEFGQNTVVPGLKSGGRAAKASGGSAEFKQAFRAARNAFMKGEGPKNFEFKGKSYSTDLYKPTTGPATRGGTSGAPRQPVREKIIDVQFGPPKGAMPKTDQMGIPNPGMKKGGRIAKQIGGALGNALGRGMPQMAPGAAMNPQQPPIGSNPAMMGRGPAPQAFANAQGRPFQPGGAFNQPVTTMPVDASMPQMYNKGGRVARAFGGPTISDGKSKTKKVAGKTNINIIIAAGGKKEPESMVPLPPPAPMGIPPMPAPAAAAAAPMGVPPMPPAAGMPPLPPMPMGKQPPAPGGFKRGGRISQVAKSFKDMTAGSGSGEGRLQKADIAKRSAHKAGGKVYRSYKDMDAGAGSGEGRLEKTEIQKHKK